MDLSTLKFKASSTSTDLLLTVKLDQEVIYRGNLTAIPQEICHGFVDGGSEHRLSIIMSGKTQDHTKIDDNGNIISDCTIRISDLSFDDILLGDVFTELSVYEHDFNGSGIKTQDKFYGEMGCNGTVTLKFTSPIYLWLLENM